MLKNVFSSLVSATSGSAWYLFVAAAAFTFGLVASDFIPVVGQIAVIAVMALLSVLAYFLGRSSSSSTTTPIVPAAPAHPIANTVVANSAVTSSETPSSPPAAH